MSAASAAAASPLPSPAAIVAAASPPPAPAAIVAASPSSMALRIDAGGDWSGLPPEIIQLISSFLTSIWDYLRFRGACSSWRSAAGRQPHTPSLILPYDPDTTARSFLDPSDLSITTINIPAAQGKWIYGTLHGWLVMLGQGKTDDGWSLNVSLLNPITQLAVLLPNLPREIDHFPEQRGRNHTKSFLLTDPISTSSGHLIALLMSGKLAFCNPELDQWTVIDLKFEPSVVEADFTFFDGAFYVVDDKAVTTVLSSTHLKKHPPPPYLTPKSEEDSFHLVLSSADLLLLKRSKRGQVTNTEVYTLDRSCSEFNWTRVEGSIGERALFVSCNCSSISLPSCDFMGRGRDLIYFAGYEEDQYSWQKVASMCISDIVAGSSIGRQPNDWTDSRSVHQYRASLSGLTWIKPSYAKRSCKIG